MDAGDFSLRSKGIAVGVSVIFQDPRQIDFDGGSYASPGAQVWINIQHKLFDWEGGEGNWLVGVGCIFSFLF